MYRYSMTFLATITLLRISVNASWAIEPNRGPAFRLYHPGGVLENLMAIVVMIGFLDTFVLPFFLLLYVFRTAPLAIVAEIVLGWFLGDWLFVPINFLIDQTHWAVFTAIVLGVGYGTLAFGTYVGKHIDRKSLWKWR